jgi:hypothetical protein
VYEHRPYLGRARAEVRSFRQAQHDRRVRLDEVLSSRPLVDAIAEFSRRSSEKGKRRALETLRELLEPFAPFEAARFGKDARALFAELICLEGGGAEVGFILVGRGAISRKPWNFACSEHALIRFFERGGQELEGALIEANRASTKGFLYTSPNGTEVLIPGGRGVFVGATEPGGFDGLGRCSGRTWLSENMLGPDQHEWLSNPPQRSPAELWRIGV